MAERFERGDIVKLSASLTPTRGRVVSVSRDGVLVKWEEGFDLEGKPRPRSATPTRAPRPSRATNRKAFMSECLKADRKM